MKINFTKKEFRLLLELVYLGDHVMHGSGAQDHEDHHAVHDLMDRLVDAAEGMGCGDVVQRYPRGVGLAESFTHELHSEYLVPFEHNILFELAARELGIRDYLRFEKGGQQKLESGSFDDLMPYVQRLRDEFDARGFENVDVRLGHKPATPAEPSSDQAS